jgi:mxaJ protein
MSSVCREFGVCLLVLSGALLSAGCPGRDTPSEPNAPPRVLRVCADPNNLPFSNDRREGLENALADLVAADLGATVEYTWWAQRRGFVRNTLRAGTCDVIMGVPAGYDPVLTTRPYYRSSYAFVSRTDRQLHVTSLDDARLREWRIGVHVIGDDYANPPPAHVLARRGLVANVVGYSIYGDYGQPDPPTRLLDAVAAGDIDVAVAWGPLAGAYARRASVPLDVETIEPPADLAFLPFAFDIALGVRRDDRALRDELDAVLTRNAAAITQLLDRFGVPRLPVSARLEARR